ncbi:MAG: ROK family protein, partial [Clostridia bacterium]|nr:ROK family protein [Clostridia bacterium]
MLLKVKAPLDPGFMPMAVVYREFEEKVKAVGGQTLTIGLVRNGGLISVYTVEVFKDGTGHDEENHDFVERIVKTLLWARGGYKIIISGSPVIAERIKADYAVGGIREFDRDFMSGVYETPFEVVASECAPVENEAASPVGRHLDGCRIGFDAGGSDRKVSSVVEGEATYSEEVVWFPKLQNDPQYHYDGIMSAMKTAASKMPRVDGIGVSTAGVVVGNRIMTSSLFLKVKNENPEAFERVVKNIYTDIAKEFGDVPI